MKKLSKIDEFAVNAFLNTSKKLIHKNKKQLFNCKIRLSDYRQR